MTPADHPRRPGNAANRGPVGRDRGVRLADEAPLARAAVAASVAGVLFGFCFIPQLLGLAVGGISLAREPQARRQAALAIVIALVLTVLWGLAIAALIKWWASSRA